MKVRWPSWLSDLVELLLIGGWALWVGRAYLDFNPHLVPTGREFGMAIQPTMVWTLLPKCGLCVLWNGFVNGGYPAFAELHAAVLHPLVIGATLLWGGINGAKATLVACLAIGGWTQWWLAKALRLGWLPRLWSAALAVVGAHLGGRIEHGAVSVVISTAMCSLVLAPALALVLTGKRRAAVLLGVTLALAAVSGQGYMQLGLAFSLVPALGVFLIGGYAPAGVQPPLAAGELAPVDPRTLSKGLLLAGALALLLAGIFWVPLAHFWPNFVKDVDATFHSVQPLGYAPLNLVIHDLGFYYSETLQHLRYPYIYVTYIGWLPVLLALLPLRLARHRELRLLAFFWITIGLVYLAGTAWTFRALALVWPDLAAGVRYPSMITGLAVPLLLALAAWGLDRLLKWLSHPAWLFALSAVVAAVPLVASVDSATRFSRTWLTTSSLPPELEQVLPWLKTASAEWISFPYGEHFWTPAIIDAGLKAAPVARPWRWQDRELPTPYLEASRDPITGTVPGLLGKVAGMSLLVHPENEYAAVTTGADVVPCQATATGGLIQVTCVTSGPGTLVVQENQWSGWQARVDGRPVPLNAGTWLSVAAPAGTHHYEFRYRPWDVPVGAGLTLIGLALAVWVWRTPVAASRRLSALNRRFDRWVEALGHLAPGILVHRAILWLTADLQGVAPAEQRRRLRHFALGLDAFALLGLIGFLVLWSRPGFDPESWLGRFLLTFFALAAVTAAVVLYGDWKQRRP